MVVTLGQQYNVGEKPTVILFASPSHTHYLYDVGMSKVPAVCTTLFLFLLFFWCPCMAINVAPEKQQKQKQCSTYRRYFRHAHFMQIVGVGIRGEY